MRTIAKLGLALGVFAALSYGENLTGKLIDAACHEKSAQAAPEAANQKSDLSSCQASASTTSFAVQTADGKVIKLDAAGNAKASTAIKGNPDNKSPMATVSGTVDGQTVKVDSITVR
jgi:hypothetical protein